MYVDSHVHLQPHGEAPAMTLERIELYVEQGSTRGVGRIALTEHLFRFTEAFDHLYGWWDLDGEDPSMIAATEAYWRDHVSGTIADYVRTVEQAKSAGLPVLLGIELDWIPGRAEELARLLAPYDWDVVLGSVHWIGAWGFDSLSDDVFAPAWNRRDIDDTFETYGALVSDLAAAQLADVLAHPDLPKLAGHRPASPTSLHDTILAAAQNANCAIEVNANGYNKPCAAPYPAPEMLSKARAAGLSITLASDAHRPQAVGQSFDELAAYARGAGYQSFISFEQRKAVEHALPATPFQSK
jgi:histidinol-phosphatase (PHP family)